MRKPGELGSSKGAPLRRSEGGGLKPLYQREVDPLKSLGKTSIKVTTNAVEGSFGRLKSMPMRLTGHTALLLVPTNVELVREKGLARQLEREHELGCFEVSSAAAAVTMRRLRC